MKKPIVVKGLVVAVILLFIGIAVTPSINALNNVDVNTNNIFVSPSVKIYLPMLFIKKSTVIVVEINNSNPDYDYYIKFDWGDDVATDWIGANIVSHNGRFGIRHTWEIAGDFEIKYKFKDSNGYESDWSPSCPITVFGKLWQSFRWVFLIQDILYYEEDFPVCPPPVNVFYDSMLFGIGGHKIKWTLSYDVFIDNGAYNDVDVLACENNLNLRNLFVRSKLYWLSYDDHYDSGEFWSKLYIDDLLVKQNFIYFDPDYGVETCD